MQISISDVESRRFGFVVVRANDFTADNWTVLQKFCEDNGAALAVVRVSGAKAQAIHALEDAGARLMDTLVDYRLMICGDETWPECQGFVLRTAEAGDVEDIRQVALRVFSNYSSHYTADSRLDTRCISEGYAEWATSYVLEPFKCVCVALAGDKIMGFSAVEFDKEKSEGRLALVGIDEAARGKGIYPAFLRHHLAWCKDQGGREFCAATQITNLRSQNVWLRFGFEPCGIVHTFHKWFAP